ncbi:MAG: hypothetical protein LUF30_11920 [Lachnospiraceae bacterium]|nr:hypothetical protein [Lachnospiraceae bacterium]
MKKEIISGLLILGAASMLCGFDSTETAESIMHQMAENTRNEESMTSDLTLNCDLSLVVSDDSVSTSIDFLAGIDFVTQVTLDPLAAMVDGTVTLSTFGMDETIVLQLYAVSDDDTLNTYIYMEDSASDEEGEGSWEYTSADLGDSDLQSLIDTTSTMHYSDLTEWGISFALASEAADFDGTECYLLTSTIDSSTFSTLLEKAEGLTIEDGESLTSATEDADIDAALELLDGLVITIEYYVDTTTYLPVAFHMDFNDSDLTVLNEYVASYLAEYLSSDDESTIEIVLNDLSLDMTMSYDDVEVITVPEEALEAVASGEAEDLEDLIEEYVDEADVA